MKKFKKLFLVVSIVAVLMVMMVVSVSAASKINEFDYSDAMIKIGETIEIQYYSQYGRILFYLPEDENTPIEDIEFLVFKADSTSVGSLYGYTIIFSDLFFDEYVEYIAENKDNLEELYNCKIDYTAESFFDFICNYYDLNKYVQQLDKEDTLSCSTAGQVLDVIYSDENYSYEERLTTAGCERLGYSLNFAGDDEIKSAYISTYDNYIKSVGLSKQLTEKDTSISTLEGQVTELNTTITEKDAVITEKDNAISTLQGENANLQIDVDSLNTQVENLVEEKTVINSELKALEAKMEREIDKAYEQGYEDADGFNFMPIIACLSVVVLIVTIISFVVTNKRKKRR